MQPAFEHADRPPLRSGDEPSARLQQLPLYISDNVPEIGFQLIVNCHFGSLKSMTCMDFVQLEESACKSPN